MKVTLAVARDILREALQRRWILALAIAISAVVVVLGMALRMEVVDGALAATRLFGRVVHHDIRSANGAMQPVFQAVAYVIFYGGIGFGVLACSDFGAELFAPGRIEHLLALPIRRWQLLLGTYIGVFTLSALGALYGAAAFTFMLSVKSGVWTLRPIVAALLASATFSAIYGAMLASALFVRSAAVAAAVGGALFVLGIVAGYRDDLAPLFNAGPTRATFMAVTSLLPRVSQVANAAADFASSPAVDGSRLAGTLFGLEAFGLGCLAIGMWQFERKDF
jgi:ABC-type transport system involved in multi-copper enzyme maturation permease subunit